MAGTRAVDGGWWPRSRDPDAELPGLIAGLDASLGPITRMAPNLDAWDGAPRRLAVDGRRVRVGWFRHLDPDTVGLTRAGQDRVVLLVIPRRQPRPQPRSRWPWPPMSQQRRAGREILAAAGIDGQDPTPIPPQPPS